MSGSKKISGGLTASRLRELLHYNPDTGVWTRIAKRHGYFIGEKAGRQRHDGYWRIGVEMNRYLAHRLAWFYMTGEWPKNEIDHIDGNPANNKWNNLREATSSQQKWNTKIKLSMKKTYKDLPKGVTSTKRNLSKPFRSFIQVNGRRLYLGSFPTSNEAHTAYVKAAQKYHGEYAREK